MSNTDKIPYIYKERYLPNNDVAERKLLSCLMQDNELIRVCRESGVSTDTFYVPVHKAIFLVIDKLKQMKDMEPIRQSDNEAISSSKIADHLSQQYVYDTHGARDVALYAWWINDMEVCNSIVEFIKESNHDTSLFCYFVEIVCEKARRRKLLRASQDAGLFKASDLLANSTIYKDSKYIRDVFVVPEYSGTGYFLMARFPESNYREAVETANALKATSVASFEEDNNISQTALKMFAKQKK